MKMLCLLCLNLHRLKTSVISLFRLNVAIAGLQEVRWTGSGETSTDSYKLIWSGHESHRIQGVALAVHRKYVGSLTFWKPLGPHLMHARFKHSFGFVSLFVCYAPTEAADQEAKDTFYQMLNNELRLVSRHDITMVLGDMNATIGSNRTGLERIIGPYPPVNSNNNDNGDRMLDLCSTHNLKPLSTWFQHRKIHRITWYSNTGTVAKTIDHILVSGRWRIASDCRVFRSAELGCTDHRLLVATIHLRLRRTTRLQPRNRPFDASKLREPQHAHRYAVEVRNRFDALDEPQCMEDDWEQLRSTLTPAASDLLGERRTKKPWISSVSLDLVDRCRAARLDRSSVSYRTLNRERRRSLRRDYSAWLNSIASEAELKFNQNNLRPAYIAIKLLCQPSSARRSSALLDDNDILVTNPSSKLSLSLAPTLFLRLEQASHHSSRLLTRVRQVRR